MTNGQGTYHRKGFNRFTAHTNDWVFFTHCPSQPNGINMHLDKRKIAKMVDQWNRHIRNEIPTKKIVNIDSLFKKFEFLTKGDKP